MKKWRKRIKQNRERPLSGKGNPKVEEFARNCVRSCPNFARRYGLVAKVTDAQE